MAAASVKSQVIQRLWRGHDPMQTVVLEDRPADPQGWNSDHPYLTRAIAEVRPRIVVEVGVWKGGSVMTLARALRDLDLDGVVIAVDTWLGSWEHWMPGPNPTDRDNDDDLGFERGSPRLYEKFIANIRQAQLHDQVVPLPLDSSNAAQLLYRLGVKCGVMHLDGGHDYEAVSRDLRLWWQLIEPGGVMVCDDYYDDGRWQDVRRAVDEFVQAVPITAFEAGDGKAMFKKPVI